MYILPFKIVFISLTRQELILDENVKWKKVLFYYNLQLLHLTFLCKMKSCKVIVKNRPFLTFFAVFRSYLGKYYSYKKVSNRKKMYFNQFQQIDLQILAENQFFQTLGLKIDFLRYFFVLAFEKFFIDLSRQKTIGKV